MYIDFPKSITLNNLELLSSNFSQFKRFSDNKILFFSEGVNIYEDENGIMLFNGRLLYDGLNQTDSIKRFIEMLQNNRWSFEDDLSGYFTGFYINFLTNEKFVFNDYIGMDNLFYSSVENIFVISSSLTYLKDITHYKLRLSSLVCESIYPYSSFGNKTTLYDVFRLLPGERLKFKPDLSTESKIENQVKQKDEEVNMDSFAKELVELINKESEKLFKNENILLPLSGGLDSRLNLAHLIANNISFEAFNNGEIGHIDTDIPIKLSKAFNFKLTLINLYDNLLPDTKEKIYDIFQKTNSLYVCTWNSLLLKENFKKGSVILLGDSLDILRSQRVESMIDKKFRIKYNIKKVITGSKLELHPFTDKSFNAFNNGFLNQYLTKFTDSLKSFAVDETERLKIIEEFKSDFYFYVNFLKSNYTFAYQEAFEEIFYMFSYGRNTMGRHINLLKYKFRAEVPMTNVRIMKRVLNVSISNRYSDELTSKMFRVSSWKKVGSFPSNRSPFVNYNANENLVLFGWYIRYSIDKVLDKVFKATKGKSKKDRLFKSYDFFSFYNSDTNYNNYKNYMASENFFNSNKYIEIFEHRRSGSRIVPFDLYVGLQTKFYVDTFGK